MHKGTRLHSHAIRDKPKCKVPIQITYNTAMNILLVDDSTTIRLVTKNMLEKLGHEIHQAVNGADAVAKVQAAKPDLILLDVEMPGINGFETAQAIRALCAEDNIWVPIIFLSASMDDSLIERGRQAGGDDFLIKPLSRVVLATRLSTIAHINDMKQQIIDLQDQLQQLKKELSQISTKDQTIAITKQAELSALLEGHWQSCLDRQLPLAVLTMQIDHFNAYAQTKKQADVDTCIKILTDTLSQQTANLHNLIVRTDSDQFVVLLPGADLNQAIEQAEAIRTSIAALHLRYADSPTADHVTVSLGIAVNIPEAHIPASQFLNDANDALGDARESGHNCALINSKSLS